MNSKSNFREPVLDTLAQSGTAYSKLPMKPVAVVRGNGSDLTNHKLMKGRGQRKTITQAIMLNLIKVAERKGESHLVQSFWNTYHCQSKIRTSGDRAYSDYCKNKWCNVCQANRKAQIINSYLPLIQQWEQPYFVTLTLTSVYANKLKALFNRMNLGLAKTIRRCNKRNQRGKGIRVIGIKSLECNFNPSKRTYNPHFHLIVPNKATAELIIDEWLKTCKPKWALRKSQKALPIYNLEKGLIEVVKYGVKVFTQHDPDKRLKGKAPSILYASALYNIVNAMHGHRLFDRFGFNLPEKSKRKTAVIKTVTQYEDWNFDPEKRDWENLELGEELTGYIPPPGLLDFLTTHVNLEVE